MPYNFDSDWDYYDSLVKRQPCEEDYPEDDFYEYN